MTQLNKYSKKSGSWLRKQCLNDHQKTKAVIKKLRLQSARFGNEIEKLKTLIEG